jgi:preprotein translocase subunit SecB
MTEERQVPEANNAQQFTIQKIYTRDISFESPNSPEVFRGNDWDPTLDVQLTSKSRSIGENIFEVVLNITVTATLDTDRTAYLAEVQQAGIFSMSGFESNDLQYMLGSYCLNILFPFAREALSDLVTRGGFPQMLLSPVNFDALLQQQIQDAQGEAAAQSKQ